MIAPNMSTLSIPSSSQIQHPQIASCYERPQNATSLQETAENAAGKPAINDWLSLPNPEIA